MVVKTRNPQFSVKFISLEFGEIPVEVVRSSVRHITVRRRLGHACGSFEIELTPRQIPRLGNGVPTDQEDLVLRQYPSAARMSFLAYEAALQEAGEDELRVAPIIQTVAMEVAEDGS